MDNQIRIADTSIRFQKFDRQDQNQTLDIKQFDFEERKKIGAGTYGKVYKVLSKIDGKHYALKEIKVIQLKEGVQHQNIYQFPITALREIKLLRNLKNENIIDVKGVVTRTVCKENQIRIKAYCVMDFMDADLHFVLKRNYKDGYKFTTPQIRSILYQVINGLAHIHKNRVIHRDIKSSNILVSCDGSVKLADFGLAKFIPENQPVFKTQVVVTLSYRAPEITFTKGRYDDKIDVWAVGYLHNIFRCLAVELLTNKHCFMPRNESELIIQMFQLCGSLNEDQWPEVAKSEKYLAVKPAKTYPRNLISYLRQNSENADDNLIDLINQLMVIIPNQRLDIYQALKHRFFRESPTISEDQESLSKLLKSYLKADTAVQQPSASEQQRKKPIFQDDRPIKKIVL